MNEQHEQNLDAAQREIDRREAEGEDMSMAYIDEDYSIQFWLEFESNPDVGACYATR